MADRIVGRLAARPWRDGDPLPAVGSECLVSGVNCDVESDQHRAFGWRTVVGYGEDNKFICLQTKGCWPTVERTENCWFAEIKRPQSSDEPSSGEALIAELIAADQEFDAARIFHTESTMHHPRPYSDGAPGIDRLVEATQRRAIALRALAAANFAGGDSGSVKQSRLPKRATYPKPDPVTGEDRGPCCAHAYADGWNACLDAARQQQEKDA